MTKKNYGENSLEAFIKNKSNLDTRANQVYDFIRKYPNLTGEQIRRNMGYVDSNNILPRISDLKNKGLIIVTGNIKNSRDITVSTYAVVNNPNPNENMSKSDKLLTKMKKDCLRLSHQQLDLFQDYILELSSDKYAAECNEILADWRN